jgi:hypothetical protein
MRYNRKNVEFVIVNVQNDPKGAQELIDLAANMQVTNLKVVPMTILEWSVLVENKLGFHLPWNQSWYYKLNDYKPTFGVLLEEYIGDADWWGWMDMDIILGNFMHFRPFFNQTDTAVVSGCYSRTCGPLTMIRNTPENNRQFRKSPGYLTSLEHEQPHTLDEQGDSTKWGKFSMTRWLWDGPMRILYGNR